MADVCTDNRFELIEKYKKNLIECTNIESAQDEMAVLDDLLFRFWQMGWLDRLEQSERKTGKWISHDVNGKESIDMDVCSACGERFAQIAETGCEWNYCPNCGAKMKKPMTIPEEIINSVLGYDD